ncbi:MAG: endonuclease NucS domain-containing protein [Dehalococcoidia bacterium]
MGSQFLIQVNNAMGYPNIAENRRYENDVWMKRPRDRDHGSVEPGDTLLVYCTADVPSYPMSLAFQVGVVETSPDHITFHLGEPQWFRNPLKRERILEFVDTSQLDEVFRSCGAQGFNICRLEPPAAQRVLELLQGEAANVAAPMPLAILPAAGGSPLDRLIETKLEQWLVEHWQEVDFGSKLKLYEEDGEAVGQQYNTGVVGTIDLLCEDEESGDLVVIELKRGRPSDEVVGQLARYLGWTQRHLANGRRVRGIILAPEFDDKLRYAAAAIPDSTLLRYQTRFDVFIET